MLEVTDASALAGRIAAHYGIAGPLMESSLGPIPVVLASFPDGFTKSAQWHVALSRAPAAVATVQAHTVTGTRRYLALKHQGLEWAAHALHAVEFHSWSPRANDADRVAFARVLLEPAGAIPSTRISDAARIVRSALNDRGFDAIALRDGRRGIALWVPFGDGPTYATVETWLDIFTAKLALLHPELLTTETGTHADDRVRMHVATNTPGRFSVLPYSLRGDATLPICLPVHWEELDAIADGSVTINAFATRLQTAGDVFALERARIGTQVFAMISNSYHNSTPVAVNERAPVSHGHVIAAAMRILSDGKPRSADAILAEAIAQKLLPPAFNKKYVYTALIEYIARAQGNGRKPYIVQDPDRRFHLNEPLDDWPNPPAPRTAPAVDAKTQALIERLGVTGSGDDPAAFEIAVCEAFAHLGFGATHVGGAKAPDGYADAQLGVLGYRVMIECKTAKGVVSQPDAFEAAKYRDPYHAQYCTLIGPAFADEVELTKELQTHGVSAWTVSDLQTALALQCDPHELRPLFAPGYAFDALNDLLWQRSHGEAKRIAVVADLVCTAGWKLQVTAAGEGAPSNAAMLTIDTAMALVDQALAEAGSHQGCTREQAQLAFAYLTNPVDRKAVWTDETQTAIVITKPVPG